MSNYYHNSRSYLRFGSVVNFAAKKYGLLTFFDEARKKDDQIDRCKQDIRNIVEDFFLLAKPLCNDYECFNYEVADEKLILKWVEEGNRILENLISSAEYSIEKLADNRNIKPIDMVDYDKHLKVNESEEDEDDESEDEEET